MEEKRNVNVSFKTTSSNKLNWLNQAKQNGMTLSEFVHCAVELYYEDSIGKAEELKEQISVLSKELSKTKNELNNIKLQEKVNMERLETVVSGLKHENKTLREQHQKHLNKIRKLQNDQENIHKRIDNYAQQCNGLQIGLFSIINSDEVRGLKGGV